MEIGIVKQITVEEEMRNSYLDYAMSVIVSRALPDVRDGLKPSQRRVMVAMHDLNLQPGRPYRKCAKICGDTSGNYHPHGEAVIYPTLVRLAQTFNMRYPLVDGQGNFGSVDGDPPAAMRYTESRLTPMAVEMLADIDKDTVDWQSNYDGTRNEPTVLPARFPNLICNGSSGIAVGMATNIPPHNLTEVVGALLLLIDNPETTIDDLCKHITGPDFPTGGILITREKDPKTGQVIDNAKHAYATGHGRVLIRARARIDERRAGFFQIVVTELPYQVNKATLQEKIAELVRSKRIDGISDMRDESDRQGMRLVIELKREASPRTVLNQLYKYTAMQTAFGINMLALVVERDEQGVVQAPQPRVLTLKRMLQHFLDYRHEVLTRRTQFELEKARARAHILEGLKIALDHLDAVIRTIRESASAEVALATLQTRFTLSEIQARAILDMQLRRLAALERQQILDEYAEILKTIARLEDLLANPRKILYLVRDDLVELRKKYGDARRTEVATDIGGDLSEEDLVPNDEVLVTISGRGYVKRLRSDTYRVQRRGGKGIRGQVLREEDALRHMIIANARDNVLFFTNRGKVYQTKAYQIPEFERTARGVPLINVIDLDQKETVTAVLAAPDFENNEFLIMATRFGEIKKTSLQDFATVRRNGLNAMDLEPDDELRWVKHCTAGCEVMLVSEQGQALRFPVDVLRNASRSSGGVRGLRLAKGDFLAGMDIVDPKGQLLVVTELGMGKRTLLKHYEPHGRGTGGVKTLNITRKTGPVCTAQVVHGDEELMLISKSGIVIRTELTTISQQGRASQGVAVMYLKPNDKVACIAVLDGQDGEREVDAGDRDEANATGRRARGPKTDRPLP
ncbi:MAG: DNA gyrase subunit A [Chloroflexi bacterium]|nr:DNA gyrase subunit A [Chloroflexota bacterium]